MSFGPFPNDPGLGGSVAFGLAANAPAVGTVPSGYQYVATDTNTVTYYSATNSYTIGGNTTPTLINKTSAAASTPTGSPTSSAISTTGASLIVAALGYNSTGSGTPHFTDSQGNTYQFTTSYAGTAAIVFAYCISPSTSPNHTFTASPSYGSPEIAFSVAAFSGTGAFDTQAGNESGSGVTVVNAGPITPAENNALLITAISDTVSANATVNNQFIALNSVAPGANNFGVQFAYKIGTANSITAQWTLSSASDSNGVAYMIADFLP